MHLLEKESEEFFSVLLVPSLMRSVYVLKSAELAERTLMVEKRGKRLITSYTNSGMKDSPYCSNSTSFSRIRNCSTETAESITRNSRVNMILGQISAFPARGDYRLYSHRVHHGGITFEAMCRSLADNIKKIIERYTEKEYL